MQMKLMSLMVMTLFLFVMVFCNESLGSDNNSEIMCEEMIIPVKLKAKSFSKYNVAGTLCRENALDGKALYVLISGSTYGPVYWDFPIQADTYSFVRAAVKAGYATFNLSRIGIGESDHPFGLLIDVDSNAYVVHQVIKYLNDEVFGELSLGSVMTVGHSVGSLITVAHAIQFPQDVDGVILTGFIHNVNPDYIPAIREASYLAFSDPRFTDKRYDFTYLTSKPGSREIFYCMDQADPDIITVDESTKETTTLGEVISTMKYFGEKSLQIKVPVLQVIGDEDIVGCGGEVDCHDHNAVIANEQQYFSDAACVETHVVENTGHNLNLHPNALSSYQTMLDWSAKRVGAGAEVPPTEPCKDAGRSELINLSTKEGA